MRRSIAILSLAVFMGPLASSSYAQTYTGAGDGGSATDQYTETIPDVTGDHKPDKDNGSAEISNPPGALRELENSGSTGAEAAAVIASTRGSDRENQAAGGGKPESAGRTIDDSSPNALEAEPEESGLSATASGWFDSGMGVLLAVLLIVTIGLILALRSGRRTQNKP